MKLTVQSQTAYHKLNCPYAFRVQTNTQARDKLIVVVDLEAPKRCGGRAPLVDEMAE
jgi:hypothetical protein